jgi:hypothetical protein
VSVANVVRVVVLALIAGASLGLAGCTDDDPPGTGQPPSGFDDEQSVPTPETPADIADVDLLPSSGLPVLATGTSSDGTPVALLGAPGDPDGYCIGISTEQTAEADGQALRWSSCATQAFLDGSSERSVVILGSTFTPSGSDIWFGAMSSPLTDVTTGGPGFARGHADQAFYFEVAPGGEGPIATLVTEDGTATCVVDADATATPICDLL